MKKTLPIAFIFSFALLLVLAPAQAFAEKYTDGATGYTYEYEILSDNGSGGGAAALASITAPDPAGYDPEHPEATYGTIDFTIPSTVDGYTITTLSFAMPREIKSVKIPATVTTLTGDWADSRYLKTVTFATGCAITQIPENFFYNSGITAITLPDTVTTIADRAFANCFNLRSVTLSSSLRTIGERAFFNTPMDSITFPNGLQTIGDYAFANQKSYGTGGSLFYTEDLNLKAVVIPDSVTSIGSHAFAAVEGASFVINDSSADKMDRSNYEGMTAISTIELGSGLKTIGDYAFAGSNITTLTLPASLETLGEYAFSYNINLKSVNWSDAANAKIKTVTGFDYCYSLASFVIPAGTKAIGDEAFNCAEKLTGVTIPEGVQTIGRLAFANISALGDVVIPSTVTSVGESAFTNTGMKSLIIKDGSTSLTLGYTAFSGITGLARTTVELPERVVAISGGTFARTKSIAFVIRNDALRIEEADDSAWRISNANGDVDMSDPWGSVYNRELWGDTDSIVYYPNTMTEATSPTFMQYLGLVSVQKERAENPYVPFDRYGDVWPDFKSYNAKTENPAWDDSGSGSGGDNGSGGNGGDNGSSGNGGSGDNGSGSGGNGSGGDNGGGGNGGSGDNGSGSGGNGSGGDADDPLAQYAGAAAAAGFKDLNPNDWYMGGGEGRGGYFPNSGTLYMDYAIAKGLMSGYDATTFGPDNALNRGMVATIIYRAATGATAKTTDNNVTTKFSDVKPGDWYAAAVKWCSDNGVVTGYTDGSNRFGPEDPVTREQMATMIGRYLVDVRVMSAVDASGASAFKDASSISGYAKVHVAFCSVNGIMSGIGTTGRFAPLEGATRCQMAKVIAVTARMAE